MYPQNGRRDQQTDQEITSECVRERMARKASRIYPRLPVLVLRTTQKEVLGRWSRPYLVECRLKDGLELLRSYGEFDLVMCGEERPFRTSSDPLLLKTTTMREEAGGCVQQQQQQQQQHLSLITMMMIVVVI